MLVKCYGCGERGQGNIYIYGFGWRKSKGKCNYNIISKREIPAREADRRPEDPDLSFHSPSPINPPVSSPALQQSTCSSLPLLPPLGWIPQTFHF